MKAKRRSIFRIVLFILVIMTSAVLSAQDGYTILRERYLENQLSDQEYSTKLRSLYQSLRTGEYQPKQNEMAIKCIVPVRVEMMSRLTPLQKTTFLDHRARPQTEFSYKTETGNFIIHYDTTGTNAVELNYTLGKSVPDWIYETGLAYEWARYLLVDSLGYNVPPIDSAQSPEYDVYLIDLSGRFYGETAFEFGEEMTQSSWIESDNDFVEDDYFSNGLDGMKVTAVHEYFHAVQLAYVLRFADFWFFELASTWFEDVGYDDVNDYVQYMRSYYNVSDRSLFESNGYQVAIFGKFLEENYDIGLMRSIWELIATNSAEASIDKALKIEVEKSDGIKAAFGKFALWVWYTGSRSVDGAFFEEASLYPQYDLEDDNDILFSNEAFISPLLGLEQLAFKLYRFTPTRSSALKAMFIADNKPKVWGSAMTAQPPLIISLPPKVSANVASVTSLSGLIVAAANGSYKVSDVGRERYSIEVRVTGIPPSTLISLYPNPLEYDVENTIINITYDLGAAINSGLFTVYDLLGRTMYQEVLGTLSQGENSLTLTTGQLWSSGIYIFQISGDDIIVNGKFTLLR